MSKYNNRSIAVAKKQLPKQENAKTGFTLVELLVVIAIIALLMSILMPALRRVKMQAEEVKCKANMKQVGLIIYMYLQDEDFKMPDCHVIDRSNQSNRHLWTVDGAKGSARMGPDDGSPYSYWATAYNEYVRNIDIFGCAAMTQFAEMLARDLIYNYASVLALNVKPADVIKTAAFGLNGFLDQLNTNNVRTHSEIVILTDHVEPRVENSDNAGNGDCFAMGSNTTENLTAYREGGSREVHYRGIFRHSIRLGDNWETGGKAGMLWLDGHVSMQEETLGFDIPNRFFDPRGNGFSSSPKIGWLDI